MAFDQYAAPRAFFQKGGAPTHVVAIEDQERLQTYDLYEDIYWTQPQTYKIQQRGSDSAPIYLPSARGMVEACNRFLCVDFGYLVVAQDDTTKQMVTALVNKIFKRELFFTKFATQKRYGLIRGDAFWHITADELAGAEGEGERISIHEVDAREVFPIKDSTNVDKTIGYHLVEVILDPDDPNKTKRMAKRQTYRKQEDGTITSELMFFEPDKWDDRNIKETDLKPIRKPGLEVDEFTLPPVIKSLPVYQVKNSRIPGLEFGMSEVFGIERVFGAVNQAVSDEELSLAMGGLGVFWTTSGPPKRDGQIVPWEIGPAMMMELSKDAEVGRLSGVDSVQPSIDHMNFMLGQIQFGLGIPDIAAGKVDVDIAESGISLLLQLQPLLAKNAEKESSMIEKYDQMFFDLVHMWLVAFEGMPEEALVSMVAVAGDPLPQNRQAKIAEIIALATATPPLLSLEETRRELQKLGYELQDQAAGGDSSLTDPIITQERLLAQARSFDPFAERLAAENGAGA